MSEKNKLSLKLLLKNCKGINKIDQTFVFENDKHVLVYASNGTMKTSLANTFIDLSNGEEPYNKVTWENPKHEIEILEEKFKFTSAKDYKKRFYVIESIKQEYNFNIISKLLVNNELKLEYDDIHNEINDLESKFITKINKVTGLKVADIKETFMNDFPLVEGDDFLEFLLNLKGLNLDFEEFDVEKIHYNDLFNNDVLKILKDSEVMENLNDFSEKYHELLEKSEIYNKNFTQYNASEVSKALSKNKYFDADHGLIFNCREGNQSKLVSSSDFISTNSKLKQVIKDQENQIFEDEILQTKFDNISKKLNRNGNLRTFKNLIRENKYLIPKFNEENLLKFKQDIWLSVLSHEKEEYDYLIKIYCEKLDYLNIIIEKARNQESLWREVVDVFNDRFLVPFTLKVSNQEDVLLKKEMPAVNFCYDEKKLVNQKELYNIISAGEKRALYLLNILYELKNKEKEVTIEEPLFLIIDDIADSFDYQNKYAIIEYLKELIDENGDIFKLIILTHNYDFFRTVKSRLTVKGFIAEKSSKQIFFNKKIPQDNLFKSWEKNLQKDDLDYNKLIASIPFLRNLIELKIISINVEWLETYIQNYVITDDEELNYCILFHTTKSIIDITKNVDFNFLTTFLHIKKETKKFKIKDLKYLYSEWGLELPDNNELIYDIIMNQSDEIYKSNKQVLRIENKIVLSMAIRLLAEEYMLSKLENFESKGYNQTGELFKKFKEIYPGGEYRKDRKLLEKVILMTPENIHINSFMYEPILDMSNEHLKSLYSKIKQL